MDQNTNQPESFVSALTQQEVHTNTLHKTPNPNINPKNTIIIICIAIVILLVMGTMWHFIKNKSATEKIKTVDPNIKTITQTNMTNDMQIDFVDFFKEFRAEAAKNNLEFVKKTLPSNMLDFFSQWGRDENKTIDEVIAEVAKDFSKITDEMIIAYGCKENICFATVVQDAQESPKKIQFVLNNGSWFLKDDDVPSTNELNTLNSLANEYHVSFFMTGNAIFKLFLNGKELYSANNPVSRTFNMQLMVNKGENVFKVEIIPEGEQSITYGYDLYEFPKGSGPDAIFNDDYKFITSAKSGEFINFVKLNIFQLEKIEIPFIAK